jgi:hypothetical protein
VSTGGAFTFTVIFPPSFYIFPNRAISGFENHNLPTDAVKGDPDHNIMLLPMIVAGIVRAANSSRVDPHHDFSRSTYSYCRTWRISSSAACMMPEGRRLRGRGSSGVVAKPKLRHLPGRRRLHSRVAQNYQFNTSMFNRKSGEVTAVSDLTLDVLRLGIFVLLGSNGLALPYSHPFLLTDWFALTTGFEVHNALCRRRT